MRESSQQDSARRYLPRRLSLEALRDAAAGCEACDLHLTGTQTVFGEGPRKAALMFVGEQPGDIEDRVGQPFVGPAGRLLDEVLEEVGIECAQEYVTNVVKHFKWVARGKRRIHMKPNAREIHACVPWLEAELKVVAPRVLVCLGATAAQALLGSDFRVTRSRGVPLEDTGLAKYVVATVHPSSILRYEDEERAEARRQFADDLRVVKGLLDVGKT